MMYLLGASGALLFIIVFTIDGWTRPGYSPIRHPVSALALGPRGWIQTTSFVLCGGAIAAAGLSVIFWAGHWLLGSVIAVFGLGLVASGVFAMDPMRGYPPGTADGDPIEHSRAHQLHDQAGMVVFAALPVAAAIAVFVLPDMAWRISSALVAVGLTVGFAAFGAAWENDSPRTGLIQRAVIVLGWLWLAALFGYFANIF